MTIARSSALVLPVLAPVQIQVLRSVVKGKRVSSWVLGDTTGNWAVDPQLRAFGGADLDLIVRVRCWPRTNVVPVPIFARRLGGYRVVEEVDIVLGGARDAAQSVGSCYRERKLGPSLALPPVRNGRRFLGKFQGSKNSTSLLANLPFHRNYLVERCQFDSVVVVAITLSSKRATKFSHAIFLYSWLNYVSLRARLRR